MVLCLLMLLFSLARRLTIDRCVACLPAFCLSARADLQQLRFLMLHGLKKLTQCMNNLLLGGRMALDVIGSQVRAGSEWSMLHADLMASDAMPRCQSSVRMGEGSEGSSGTAALEPCSGVRACHKGCCDTCSSLILTCTCNACAGP